MIIIKPSHYADPSQGLYSQNLQSRNYASDIKTMLGKEFQSAHVFGKIVCYTPKAVSILLGVSMQTVQRYIDHHCLMTYRNGIRTFITEESIDRFIKNRKMNGSDYLSASQ